MIRTYEEVFDLATHRTTYVGASEFFGRNLDSGESTPQQVMEAIHPDDVPKLARYLESLVSLQDGESMEYELRFRHTDGAYVLVRYISTPVSRNRNGLVQKVRSVVTWLSYE